jgi:type I restriction enzyme S subunit
MGFKQEKFKKLIEHKSGYTWGKEQELDKPEDGTVRVLTVTNIQEKLDLSNELYLKDVKDRDRKEKSVSKDWTIAVSSNGNRKRIGNAVFVSDDTDYLFASFLTAFKPKEDADIIPEYFFQWFSSHVVQERITSVSEGTTGLGNLDIRYLRNMVIEYPDNEAEQKAIATILSKVDDAIKANENSIKAAEKLKRSLMQNLLSGKLKPNGTWRKEDEFYKDEKFGNVPVGWKMKAIGDNSNCDINPNYKFIKGREYDFIPMEAINDSFGGVSSSIEKRVIDGGGYTRYKEGDILFAKITPCTENGKVALIKECGTGVGFASTEFIVFSPKDSVDNLFFYYLLSSSSVHMLAVSLMEGTTGRQRVPWKVFKNRIFAPIPSDINEQKAIAELISSVETQNHKKTVKINRLMRLKKSLMQNLLTGKVRVDLNKIEKLINEN